MENKISIKKIWEDDDILELTFNICSGESKFVNNVYEGQGWIEDVKKDVESFMENKVQELTIEIGAWGRNRASGYIQIFMRRDTFGKIFISTLQQADYHDSSNKSFAEDARFYLVTEPSFLDEFFDSLLLLEEKGREVSLKCVDFPNKDNSYFKVLEPLILPD